MPDPLEPVGPPDADDALALVDRDPAAPDAPDRSDRSDPSDPSDTGRSRLWRALLQPSRGQVVVAVLLALVGFAGITQVRSNEVDDTYSGYRQQDLIDVLNGLAGTTQRAQAELTRLQAQRDDLQTDTNARQAALERAQQDASTLSILAGLVKVTGPGIRVTVKESTTPVGISAFIDMLQGLRTAGAEAMQINGQVRVIAQTSFEEGVGGVRVDGVQLAAPYTIDVIGEPHALTSAIVFPRGPKEQLEDDGATVTIDERDSIDIEAVRDPRDPQYAQAVGAQ